MELREDIALFVPVFERIGEKLDTILELGSANGNGSTYGLCKGILASGEAEHKVLVSVDWKYEILDEFKPQIPNWTFIEGDTRKTRTVHAVRDILGSRVLDVLFIDTIHEYVQLNRELKIWSSLAHRDYTIYLFHDTNMFGRPNFMVNAINAFSAYNRHLYYYVISDKCNGMAALIPKSYDSYLVGELFEL